MAAEIILSRKSRAMSNVSAFRGTKQWEMTMRMFHESKDYACKAVSQSMTRMPRSKKVFPTGSTYEGSWNELGMSGKGIYEFPIDAKGEKLWYEGDFENGEFHGEGDIHYPSGAILKGKWQNGKLVEKKLLFPDELEYTEDNWYYCSYPDRRYTVEYDHGISPAGESYITFEKPPVEIPPGFYDVGDGFFNPKTRNVVRYHNFDSVLRSVCEREEKWILETCRVGADEPLGPCPFLYDEWVVPLLEAEQPPPPAARTVNYIEELLEQELWRQRIQTRHRSSANPRSRSSRSSQASRQSTGSDFYRPESLMEERKGKLAFSWASKSMSRASRARSMFSDRRETTKSQMRTLSLSPFSPNRSCFQKQPEVPIPSETSDENTEINEDIIAEFRAVSSRALMDEEPVIEAPTALPNW